MSLLAACAGSVPQRPTLSFPVPPEVTYDLATAQTLPDAALAARLADVRLLFLGEHHNEARSHAFQLALIRALAEAGRRVTVGLEMLPPSADKALDAWRDGKLEETAFLEQSGWYRHWGFPWDVYRPLFLAFRDARLTVRGLNAAPETREAVHLDKLAQLPPDVAAELAGLDAPAPHTDYLRWALNRAGHNVGQARDDPRLAPYRRVQTMWDRLIGLRAARLAEAQEPGGIVVVLVGSGHLAYKLGANLQAARASRVAQLSVVDDVVDAAARDAQGHYAVPLGLGDWVRVYPHDEHAPRHPTLGALKLAPHPRGVLVESLSRFNPHVPAGLRSGDVIVSLAGRPVGAEVPLRLAWERLAPGQPVPMAILRGDAELTLTVTPAADASD
ncbi:MAG: ChaN family lipoprotein [Candidatus Lambdaproteobacteria bacterium]|nr:ChaN family lipoprotein [Candidatus Lambdaproteobacteria bacterium]